MNRRPPSRGLSDDDLLVWRAVARTARPLPGRAIPETGQKSAPPEQERTQQPSIRPHAAPQDRGAKRPAPPAEISGERRIRRGQVEVDARIDLHGMTLREARAAIGRFVARQRAEGARILLVITGKGRAGEGAIRRALPEWLAEEAEHVAGYAAAHARHGGTGAVYVRLRRLPTQVGSP